MGCAPGSFALVLWHSQSVDHTRDKLLICDLLTKVLKFNADPFEISHVASQRLTGLDGAVKLSLETLGMIMGIILMLDDGDLNGWEAEERTDLR